MNTLVPALIGIVLQTVSCAGWSSDVASKLLMDLTANSSYHTFVPPSLSNVIAVEFGISSLIDLDIVSQQISVVGFLLLAWTDDRLSWKRNDYADIPLIYVKATDIWVPPVVLTNAADKVEVLADDRSIASVPVRLQPAGIVIWLAPVSFQAACDVNIMYYPFDSQTCSVLVSSWMYSTSQLQLMNGAETVNIDLFQENGEWDLVSSSTISTSRMIHGQGMSALEFQMVFERKYSYYVINMVLPVVILALLSSLVFLLPVQSGEKNGFSLTILLSLSVVLTIVSDSIPTTSTHVCILSVYLLTTFVACSLEVLITVLTVRCFHKHEIGYQLPAVLQKIMRAVLVPITRYRKPTDESCSVVLRNDGPKRSPMKPISIIHVGTEQGPDDQEKIFKKRETSTNDVTGSENESEVEFKFQHPVYTYQDFASVVDTFCFVLFLTITCVITVVFMLLMSTNVW